MEFLSSASDSAIELILLRIEAKDLLRSCALVSTQWNRILSAKSFWVDWAELRNYRLSWRNFIPSVSLQSVCCVAVRQPFGRNLVRDAWDLSKMGSSECFVADPRWSIDPPIVWTTDESGDKPRIEIPPHFLDGPKAFCAENGTEEAVDECVALTFRTFRKRIVIKLADEGLTDEILDNFAPPIVITELVAHRNDCASSYKLASRILTDEMLQMEVENVPNSLKRRSVQKFLQWEKERWHKVEHTFSNYTKGVRHLVVDCWGKDDQFWAGNYGPKVAKFSVKVLWQLDNNNSGSKQHMK